MFPNAQDAPLGPPQGVLHQPVAGLVAGEFLFPKRTVAGRLRPVFGAAVPEAAVHKNREFELWKKEIRFAEDFWMSPPADDFVPSK